MPSLLSRRPVVVAVSVSAVAFVSIASFSLVYKLLKYGLGTGGMARTMTKISFYPTLFYNVAMEKLSSRRWYDRIDANVILGAIPFRSSLPHLVVDENVRGVITLNEAFELSLSRPWSVQPEEWKTMGVKHLHLEVVDLVAAPSMEQTRKGVDFIKEAKRRRESVYVHCKAGRTRSATVVAAYLIEEAGMTPQEAEVYLKSIRSHVSIRQPQRRLLRDYYNQFLTRSPPSSNTFAS